EHFRLPDHFSIGGVRNLVNFAPVLQAGIGRHNERRRKFLSLAYYHGLFNYQTFFQFVLDLLRGYVFPAGSLEHFLFAVGDLQVFAFFHNPDIAGVEPAIFIDHFGGKFWFVVIAFHYARATGQDLTVFGNFYFYSVYWRANRSDHIIFGLVAVYGNYGAGFG